MSFFSIDKDTYLQFNDNSIKELANIEYENIKKCLSDDFDVKGILKSQINNSSDLYLRMVGLSPFERYPYLKDQLPTTPYLVGSLNSPYKIDQYDGGNGINYDNDYPKLLDNLKIDNKFCVCIGNPR